MADTFDDVQLSNDLFANVQTAEPVAVRASIAQIVDKLPEEDRIAASKDLNDGIQEFLSNCREGLVASMTRETARIRGLLVEQARLATERKLEELVRQSGPMNAEDMQKLVTQEYLRFPIKLEYHNAADGAVDYSEKSFTIREVPQTVEKKLMDTVLHQIVPAITKVQGIKFATGASNVDKLHEAIKVVPEVFDMVSEMTAICLNPYGKDTSITKEWVQENVSSSRMFAILQAQFMANRIRDFFSGAYRVSLGM